MRKINKESATFKVAAKMTEEFDDARAMTLKEMAEHFKLDPASCYAIRAGIFAQRIYQDNKKSWYLRATCTPR